MELAILPGFLSVKPTICFLTGFPSKHFFLQLLHSPQNHFICLHSSSGFFANCQNLTFKMLDDIPNLRLGGYSTFFDNDLTYFHIAQDFLLLISFVCLTWDLLDSYPLTTNGDISASRRLHGISVKTLFLYALSFTTRLAEYYPFDFLSYDLATCAGFASIFWVATLAWAYFNSRQIANAVQERQNNGNQQNNDWNYWNLIMRDSGRPVWLHITVGVTAILAYVYNYNHLQLTPTLFLWAWSHYLDGVAMLPQMWTLVKLSGNKNYSVNAVVWTGVNVMVLSRFLQLVDWGYLWLAADMLDVLAVVSALFHLACYAIFRMM